MFHCSGHRKGYAEPQNQPNSFIATIKAKRVQRIRIKRRQNRFSEDDIFLLFGNAVTVTVSGSYVTDSDLLAHIIARMGKCILKLFQRGRKN